MVAAPPSWPAATRAVRSSRIAASTAGAVLVRAGVRPPAARLESRITALAEAPDELVDPGPRDPMAPGQLGRTAPLQDHRVDHVPSQPHRCTPLPEGCPLCPETSVHYVLTSHTIRATRFWRAVVSRAPPVHRPRCLPHLPAAVAEVGDRRGVDGARQVGRGTHGDRERKTPGHLLEWPLLLPSQSSSMVVAVAKDVSDDVALQMSAMMSGTR